MRFVIFPVTFPLMFFSYKLLHGHIIYMLRHLLFIQEERQRWVQYHKRKWALQAEQRRDGKRCRLDTGGVPATSVVRSSTLIGGFMRCSAKPMMDTPWQIVQVVWGEYYAGLL